MYWTDEDLNNIKNKHIFKLSEGPPEYLVSGACSIPIIRNSTLNSNIFNNIIVPLRNSVDPIKDIKIYKKSSCADFLNMILNHTIFFLEKDLVLYFEKVLPIYLKTTKYKDLILKIEFSKYDDLDYYIVEKSSFYRKNTKEFYFNNHNINFFNLYRGSLYDDDSIIPYDNNFLLPYKKMNYYSEDKLFVETSINCPKNRLSVFLVKRNENKEIIDIVYLYENKKIYIKDLKDIKEIPMTEESLMSDFFNKDEINIIHMLMI